VQRVRGGGAERQVKEEKSIRAVQCPLRERKSRRSRCRECASRQTAEIYGRTREKTETNSIYAAQQCRVPSKTRDPPHGAEVSAAEYCRQEAGAGLQAGEASSRQ